MSEWIGEGCSPRQVGKLDMGYPHTVRVSVYYGEQYSAGDDWPLRHGAIDSLVGAIEWFKSKLDKIPEVFRNCAQCEIETDHFYDSEFVTISIYYDRPETDEEAAKRRADEQTRIDGNRAKELRILDALKAKYPENK